MPQLALALALTVLAAAPRSVLPRWETHGPAYPLVDVVVAGLHDDTVYAGARDPERGLSALFRTEDGGLHWSMLAQAPGGETIRRLAIDPTDPRRLMALTAAGAQGTRIYRSDDAGVSWRLDSTLGGPPVGDEHLFFDPTRPDTAFLVRYGDLLRSENEGPWADVSGFPSAWSAWVAPDGTLFWTAHWCSHIPCYPLYSFEYLYAFDDAGETSFPPPCLSLLAVAYDPSDSSVAYAAGPDCADLLRSLDGGRSWSSFDPSHDLYRLLGGGKLRQLAANPRDGSVLYGLATAERASETGEILKSRDGGRSWDLLPAPDEGGVTGIAVGRSGSLYAGTPAGVFRLGPATRTVPPRAP